MFEAVGIGFLGRGQQAPSSPAIEGMRSPVSSPAGPG